MNTKKKNFCPFDKSSFFMLFYDCPQKSRFLGNHFIRFSDAS